MNKYIQPILFFFSGNVGKIGLENRIFNIACLLVSLNCFIAAHWNYTIGMPLYSSVVVAIMGIVFIVQYYFARIKSQFSTILFAVSLLSLLSFLWFHSEGLYGSIPYIYLIGLTLFITISKKNHTLYFLLTSLNVFVLILIEEIIAPNLVQPYITESAKNSDMVLSVFASFVIFFFLIHYFKKNYDEENELINKQKKELQELNAIKDRFFSIIAHDLRGPFNTILGFSEILVEETNNEKNCKLSRFAKETHSATESTLQLLENLLSWAKFHQGTVEFIPTKNNLYESVDDSIELFRAMAEAKHITVTVEVIENIEVTADRNMLLTIIRNLVSNALKFTPQHGKVSVSAYRRNDGMVKLNVEDNGIGIKKDTLEHIFKVDKKTKRKGTNGEPSSGLGLILCKEFAEKMGGKITVTSEEGKGSAFSVLLKE